MPNVNVECYLIVKATISPSGNYHTGKPSVRVSKGKPRTEANEVPIKINLELPIGLFKKPQITATVKVPEEQAPVEISTEIQDNIAKAIRESSGLDVRLIVESAS